MSPPNTVHVNTMHVNTVRVYTVNVSIWGAYIWGKTILSMTWTKQKKTHLCSVCIHVFKLDLESYFYFFNECNNDIFNALQHNSKKVLYPWVLTVIHLMQDSLVGPNNQTAGKFEFLVKVSISISI